MITRAVLDEQRKLYVKGREQAISSISAFNGAIECCDNLLRLWDEAEAAQNKQAQAQAETGPQPTGAASEPPAKELTHE